MSKKYNKSYKVSSFIQKGQRFLQQGKPGKAEAEFTKVLKLQPDNFDAHQSLGAAALQNKNYPKAIQHLTAAYNIHSNVPGLLCNLGLAYRYSQDGNVADKYFKRAIEFDPNFGAAYFNLALCQIEAQDYTLAYDTLLNAERCRPGHLGTIEQLAHVLALLDRPDEASLYFQHALQIEPNSQHLLFSYGKTQQSSRRYLDAADTYEKVLAIDNSNLDVRAKLADLLESINRPNEAEQHAKAVLTVIPHHKLSSLVMAKIERRNNDLIAAKNRLLAIHTDNLAPETDIDAALKTELGFVLDRLNEHKPAFDAFTQANKIMDQLASNINRETAFKVIGAYQAHLSKPDTQPEKARPVEDGLPSPIFLIGFPRSGTTLTEQILAANPDFITGDELTTLHVISSQLADILGRDIDYPSGLNTLTSSEISTLRKFYWDNTKATLGDDLLKGIFVDKMPLNIIHLALIEKVFPDAKIIVALRDPRDVCLSCFMQLFQLNEAMIQFLSMDSTVDYYSAVMGLWLKYRSVTKLQWIESRYEDIVADATAATNRLNTFLKAEPSNHDSSFYQQASKRIISTPSYQDVGSPIYQRALGRWKNYELYIREPLNKLAPFVSSFGYTQEK